MGVSSREQGLLKLVHPGRHVDIHKKPVIAAEILSKYPRYCIARPDVFEFPWIVVRPESVLFPGKVFYLVPYRTLYNLLKDKGASIQSTTENKSLKYRYRHHGYSPTRLNINMPEKRRRRHRQNDGCNGRGCSCVLTQLTCGNNNQDSDDSVSSLTSYVDALTEINDKARGLDIHSYSDSSFAARRCFPAEGHKHCSSSFNSTLQQHRHSGMQTRTSGVNTSIKSCIRKQDTIRKVLNLKVTFA